MNNNNNNNNMRTLNIEFRERTGKDGRKCKIPYTYDFGFSLSVSLNGGISVYSDAAGYYINYDPHFAEIRLNKDGYPVFHVTDKF